MRTVPNDGLFRYYVAGSSERLMITTPKALSELLVQRAYDFAKPAQLRASLGLITGIGVLLAEGDEHKVRPVTLNQFLHVFYTETTMISSNGNIFSPRSRSGISRSCIRFSGRKAWK